MLSIVHLDKHCLWKLEVWRLQWETTETYIDLLCVAVNVVSQVKNYL